MVRGCQFLSDPLPAERGAAEVVQEYECGFVFLLFLHGAVLCVPAAASDSFYIVPDTDPLLHDPVWVFCCKKICNSFARQLKHMKKTLLPFVVMALSIANIYGQRIDTVVPLSYHDGSQRIDTIAAISYSKDTASWQYKMESSNEKWVRLEKKNDFQLFCKHARNTAKGMVSGTIGYYGNGSLYWLNNIDEAEMAAAGITRQNAHEFVYHVVVNDSVEIVPWTSPSDFRTNDKITYAYLGKFNMKNKVVRLEMYNTNRYYSRSVWTFNDLFLPKASAEWVTLNYNNKYLFRPYQQVYIPASKQLYFHEKDWKKNAIRFNWSDSINHLAIQIKRTLQNDMYNVYLKKTIGGKTDTVYISNDWNLSYHTPSPFIRINSSYFNNPGNYEILIVPEPPGDFKLNTFDKAIGIPFTVLPSNTKAFTSVQVAVIIGACLLVFGIIFLIYYLLNKRRLTSEAQQKEIARLQLQSVRSQLNPHFMFNALAGIQNLINKQDVDATNRYLNKFARLTRHVLEDKKQDGVTIDEERTLLETYLQMEQMRFGFRYEVQIDDAIDAANTEIPAMLLQPFVENAVKHGVSSLNGGGQIHIRFIKQENGLLIEIKDNGKGFQDRSTANGNGTRLSQERIDLLNRLHTESSIALNKKSDLTGTTISIQLNGYSHAFHDH